MNDSISDVESNAPLKIDTPPFIRDATIKCSSQISTVSKNLEHYFDAISANEENESGSVVSAEQQNS